MYSSLSRTATATAPVLIGMNGNGRGPSGGRPSRTYMHIDDCLSPRLNVNALSPMETAIAEGENCFRSAEASRSFGRLDTALKDYMAATSIAIETIPQNKSFPSLSDRKTLQTRHRELMKKIQMLIPEYEKIKVTIKADNQRSGVLPISGKASTTQTNGAGSVANGNTNENGHIHKSNHDRPAVQPKPQALHGSSLKASAAGPGVSAKTSQDLADRFANLRPKNQSKDAVIPRPSPAEIAGISVVCDLPDLPKVPEAIYSPARGTVSKESANLPSSNSRGFSRTASSLSSSSQTKLSQLKDDYTQLGQPPVRPPAPPKVVIPEGDTVTPEELMDFMKAASFGFRVLIIDVRSREAFDEGHIMSQSIICVEPEVLQREHISAEDIAQSLVLAPPREQDLFNKRGDCDVIVFYNQDSEEINWRGGTPTEAALCGLYNALRHFDYYLPGDSKPAKLLKGGVNAWVNLVGNVALQTSSTASTGSAAQAGKPLAPRTTVRIRQRARPIQDAEEAKRWEQSVSNMESALIRTQEDFLRRYPPLQQVQESMIDPRPRPERPYPAAAEIYSSLPAPPTRPAPAVPRQSYSGLLETGQEEHYAATTVVPKVKERRDQQQPIGLRNPGVWCYGNSVLQALFHSCGFSAELVAQDWQTKWAVPKRAGEVLNNPQLLLKILSNLFHWMDSGKFQELECKTLMEYCNYIDSKTLVDGGRPKGHEVALGSRSRQQDADEFITFLVDHIHDETNRLRNVPWDDQQEVRLEGDSHQRTQAYWKFYRGANDSLIDKYFRCLGLRGLRCQDCDHRTYKFDVSVMVRLNVTAQPHAFQLSDLLKKEFHNGTLDGYRCDGCHKADTTMSQTTLVRMPELMCISLGRFDLNHGLNKISTKVVYPIDDLDMTPFTSPAPEKYGFGREFEGPFRYYCYAAVMHSGSLEGGHYTAFVRAQAPDRDQNPAANDTWYYCNDRNINSLRISSEEVANQAGMYTGSKGTAYLLFYRRYPGPKFGR